MTNVPNLSQAERAASAIQRILERREEARREGDYELADKIRDALAEKLDIYIKDTRNGPRWRVVKKWNQ